MKRAALLAGLVFAAAPAFAYPEFEAWSEKTSGRFSDCAMCHSHSEGPEGVKAGQIRSLSRQELERLSEARGAFEPGIKIDSPILNAFGDRIIEKLGRKKFLEIRGADPGRLVALYGMGSDLDDDGIPDAREFREGTSPVDSRSGDPWTLFTTNFRRNWLDVVMTILATLAGLYGLNQLLRWFEHEEDSSKTAEHEEVTLSPPYLARRSTRRRRTP